MDRFRSLDGIRAFAAIFVVAFHTRMSGFSGGFIGVDIFFVLSGFLVTTVLMREVESTGNLSVKKFYMRRMIRLYPALLLFLLVFAATAPFLFVEIQLLKELLLTGAFLVNYSQAFFREPVITQHSWSLAVEMHFYLLWPFVVILLTRVSPRNAMLILVSGFIVSTVWRMAAYQLWSWPRAYYALDTRISGLIIGGVIALMKWRPNARLANAIAVGSIGLILLGVKGLSFYDLAANSWGGILVDLASAGLILSAIVLGSLVEKFFASAVMVRIGLWSYGLYIWHYPIARLTRDSMDGLSAFLVTLGVSLVFAGVSFEFFEKHVSKRLRAYL